MRDGVFPARRPLTGARSAVAQRDIVLFMLEPERSTAHPPNVRMPDFHSWREVMLLHLSIDPV